VGKDLTYRVEKEGYKTAEGSSKIQEKGLSLEVTLNPQAISPTPPKKEPRSIPSMPIIPIVAAVGLVLVIIGAIYIINSPKHPPAQPATDLTGEWQGDDGGTYYIIDLGTEIWWYGEQSAVNPGWSNVGVGKRPQGSINGNDLKLRWVDIPKGQTRGQGILVLAVEKSGNKLRAQQRTGGFGGSTWTRLPSPTVASRINREVPVIPEPPFEPSAYDLTGVWQGDDGGTYYIRHIGSEIWWYGERAPENPVWANDAFGNIGGNIVNLRWVDMPKGQTRGQGILALVVENSGNTLRAQQRTGGFGGSTWTRVD
jgi:hypothetical protein